MAEDHPDNMITLYEQTSRARHKGGTNPRLKKRGRKDRARRYKAVLAYGPA